MYQGTEFSCRVERMPDLNLFDPVSERIDEFIMDALLYEQTA